MPDGMPARTPSPPLQPPAPVPGETLLLRLVAAELRQAGVSPAELAAGLGFEGDVDAPGFVPGRALLRLFVRRAIERLGRPHLGLQLGTRVDPLIWAHCLAGLLAAPDPLRMMQMAATQIPWAQAMLELHCEGDEEGVWVVAQPVCLDFDFHAFLVEQSFAALVAVHCFVLGGSVQPLRAELTLRRPQDPLPYAQALRCRVAFNRVHDRILFPPVPRPLPTADAGVFSLVERQLARQAAGGMGELITRVRQAIRRQPGTPPPLAELARQLNVAERTLRRRLHAQGLSYAGLVDHDRQLRALKLIRSSSLSLAEIAAACGYSDTRSLRRAVTRWTGFSPTRLPADGVASEPRT